MALSDTKVRSAKSEDKAYKLTDGNGLFLLVHPNGSKYWRFRYRFGGKEKMLAFGVYPDISLANAREKRDEARKLVASGVDPSEKRKEVKEEQQKEFNTFEKVARDWHATNKKWSEGHSHRVLKSFEDNIFAAIPQWLKIESVIFHTLDQLCPDYHGVFGRFVLYQIKGLTFTLIYRKSTCF